MADFAAPNNGIKFGVLLITLVNLLAWLVLLGGISSLQATDFYGDRATLGLPWFILWFQLVLILVAFVVEFQNRLSAWRSTLNILIAINTALAIVQTEKFYNYKYRFYDYGSLARLNATVAGFIILSIFNLLLIILSGSRGALSESYGENRELGAATYPHTSNVNTTPAVAPPAGMPTVRTGPM